MKKKLLTLVSLASLSLITNAQHFNKTYFPPADHDADNKGNKVTLLPWTDPNSTGDDLVVFTVNNRDKSGNLVDVDLVVTDAAGAYVMSARIMQPLEHHHITTTRDGGILFAGYTDLANSYLYILKFDMFGILQWQRQVQINTKNIFGPHENVDIEPIYDNSLGVENYYISFSEGNSIPGQQNVPTQGVVKIDENGNFQWHYCYERVNFRNEARSMTSYNPPGTNKTYIALASTGQPFGSFKRICMMTIDESGTIMTQMEGWWPLSDDERMPDIIWDAKGQHFVVVFTSNTGGVSYPVYSSLGILKVDETYTTHIASGLYHWVHAPNNMWGERNEGVSITKDDKGDNYIITGWAKILEGVVGNPPYHQQLEAPFIFKVDRTDPLTGNIVDVFTLRPLTDQNPVGHNVQYSNQFHVTDKDNQTYLVPNKHWLANNAHKPRLIKTNFNFDNCHSRNVDLMYRTPFWGHATYPHVGKPITIAGPSALLIEPTLYSVQDCSDPNYKPLSVVEAETNNSISVYPTMITDGDKDISCEFRQDIKAANVEITVTNVLGQRTYKANVKPRINYSEKIPAQAFTKGINIVSISTTNKVLHTSKVVKF